MKKVVEEEEMKENEGMKKGELFAFDRKKTKE